MYCGNNTLTLESHESKDATCVGSLCERANSHATRDFVGDTDLQAPFRNDEVQGSEGQSTVQDAAEEYGIIYSKGDVVALKHNYKRYIIPFFLAVLLKDLHYNGDAFLEDHMGLKWLEQSEEDPLVYQTGHHDDRNSPECIIGKVQIIKHGDNFCKRELVSNRAAIAAILM